MAQREGTRLVAGTFNQCVTKVIVLTAFTALFFNLFEPWHVFFFLHFENGQSYKMILHLVLKI